MAYRIWAQLLIIRLTLNIDGSSLLLRIRDTEMDHSELDISASISEAIMASSCRVACEFFDIDHSGLMLLDRTGFGGRIVAEFPHLGTVGTRIPVRNILIEENLLKTKEPIVISDVESESEGLGSVLDIFRRFHIHSVLIVPVVINNQIVGSFSLDGINRQIYFSDEHIKLCKVLATQVSAAIQSAQRADQLQAVHQATLAITRAGSESETLFTTIVREAVKLLDAKSGGLYQYHSDRDELVVVEDYRQESSIKGRLLKAGDGLAGIVVRDQLPYVILDHYSRDQQRTGIFSDEGAFEASVEVPLVRSGKYWGVLYVDDDSKTRAFTVEDALTLRSFADHATIILENAQLAHQVASAYESAKSIAKISISEKLDTTLQHIAEATHRLLNCQTVSVHVYDRHRDQLRFPPALVGLEQPEYIFRKGMTDKNSIAYNILRRQDLYVAQRARNDPLVSGFVKREQIESFVGVPLLAQGKPVGVMFISYRTEHYFTPEELNVIRLFRDQAAMVISNALWYEALKLTQRRLTTRALQSWFNLTDNAWRHEIDKHAATIVYEVEALHKALNKRALDREVQNKLDKIKRLAKRISEQPMTVPLSTEEIAESVPINDLLRERVKQLWEREPYASVEYSLIFDLNDHATIRASREWLRRVIDILIDNAVAAMSASTIRHITIRTNEWHGQLQLSFADCGPGIPKEIQKQLFEESVPKLKGEKGLGMGLLMAQAIVTTYNGTIRLAKSDSSGTTMTVEIPLEEYD